MIAAGTGHRPDKLGGYSEDVMNRLVNVAKKSILGYEKIITGMAQGWDTALAIACIEEKVPFIAAIPFLGQDRMWPKESQDRYQYLLSKAWDIKVVTDGGYAPWKMQHRNKWMVDNCDELVALWDGSEGGTGNCIKYATKVGKPIINVWSDFHD